MSSFERLALSFTVTLGVVAGCGGKLEVDPTTSSIPSSAEADTRGLEEQAGPEEGEWGTWQLLSVDEPDGRRRYDPPFLELDLHPSGEAYLWTCAGEVTGSGLRCPAPRRRECHVGTFGLAGDVWRVAIANGAGTQVGQGDITDEPSGDIAIDGSGLLPAGGHYRRVGAASRERCTP